MLTVSLSRQIARGADHLQLSQTAGKTQTVCGVPEDKAVASAPCHTSVAFIVSPTDFGVSMVFAKSSHSHTCDTSSLPESEISFTFYVQAERESEQYEFSLLIVVAVRQICYQRRHAYQTNC